MAEIKITAENFEKEVLQAQEPVLVDFWADWCGPCRMLGPVLEEIARDYEGSLRVGKVNVDEQLALAQRFVVSSIPLLILFKNGRPCGQSPGLPPQGRDPGAAEGLVIIFPAAR